jgi:hypothetical protein
MQAAIAKPPQEFSFVAIWALSSRRPLSAETGSLTPPSARAKQGRGTRCLRSPLVAKSETGRGTRRPSRRSRRPGLRARSACRPLVSNSVQSRSEREPRAECRFGTPAEVSEVAERLGALRCLGALRVGIDRGSASRVAAQSSRTAFRPLSVRRHSRSSASTALERCSIHPRSNSCCRCPARAASAIWWPAEIVRLRSIVS